MYAMAAFADQRRRRAGPASNSIQRNSTFASSLTSSITIARSSSLPQAQRAASPSMLKKGIRTPLTFVGVVRVLDRVCEKRRG